MTIRTQLTLWYAGILFCSLLLLGSALYYELVFEPRNEQGPLREPPSEQIADILVSYGLPTIFVLVIGGSWLIRRALRPVETLTAAAERVHAGNLAERIPLTGRGDEFDRLATVFNEMLARVEAGIGSVRNFTLHASHELKTPLTILSAETELALGDPATPDSERARLASQFEEIRRLASLVDTLTLLAKGDAGLPIIAREPLRFDEMLRSAVEDARLLAATHGVTLELTRCDPAPLDGDRGSLRQVLLNLLDNAMKHNQPGGWVRVDLHSGPETVELSIENPGPRIPPELLPRLFDRFVRGPGSREGSGLGLSITRTIVEAHGGTVVCLPRAEGGARFVIHLPGTFQQMS